MLTKAGIMAEMKRIYNETETRKGQTFSRVFSRPSGNKLLKGATPLSSFCPLLLWKEKGEGQGSSLARFFVLFWGVLYMLLHA